MQGDEIKFKTIRVSQKGQIAIPADVRRELGIKKGTELTIMKRGDKILIEKSSNVSRIFSNEFDYILKNADKVAKKLWENKDDEVWDKL